MYTGELTEHVSHTDELVQTRTTSEMESEMSEEYEDSTDGETSATETDTVGTPAGTTTYHLHGYTECSIWKAGFVF